MKKRTTIQIENFTLQKLKNIKAKRREQGVVETYDSIINKLISFFYKE